MRIVMLASALALVLGTACDKKDGGDGAQKPAAGKGAKGAAAGKAAKGAAKIAAPAMLEHVPADTPYVFTSYQPLPDALVDKLLGELGPLFDEALQGAEGELGDSPPEKALKAALAELKGNFNRKGFEKLGFDPKPNFVVYGVGLLPVLRVQLKNPAALKALVGRLETAAGAKAEVKKSGAQDYWWFGDGKGGAAVAIAGNELVATAGPLTAVEKVLAVALGKVPGKSLKAAGTLDKVLADHGLAPYGVGYVDGRIIADTLLGDAKGLNAEILVALGNPPPPLPPNCKAEIKGLVELGPRVVFGYESASAKSLVFSMIVEAKASLGKELAALRAPVAGLSANPKGKPLFTVGAGVDVKKVLAFIQAKAAGLQKAPFQCPMLADLNRAAKEIGPGLAMVPPVVQGIKGFSVNVEDAKFGGGPMPTGIKATAILTADDPKAIVSMAQGMIPPLANLKIAADGKPVAVPKGLIPPMIEAPTVAMKDKHLGVSVGIGMATKLTAAFAQKPEADPPLMALSYDLGRVMGQVAAQLEGAMANMPPEFKKKMESQLKMNKALAKLFGLAVYSLHLGPKGIKLRQQIAIN